MLTGCLCRKFLCILVQNLKEFYKIELERGWKWMESSPRSLDSGKQSNTNKYAWKRVGLHQLKFTSCALRFGVRIEFLWAHHPIMGTLTSQKSNSHISKSNSRKQSTKGIKSEKNVFEKLGLTGKDFIRQ